MRPIRPSAKAVIIRDGRLLALKMMDEVGYWYLLPGGGVNFGETLAQAVRREVREETGLEVEAGPLRLIREYLSAHHEFADQDPDAHQVEYMFECRVTHEANFGNGHELDPGQVDLTWLPLEMLEEVRLYPLSIRPILRNLDAYAGPVYLGDVN